MFCVFSQNPWNFFSLFLFKPTAEPRELSPGNSSNMFCYDYCFTNLPAEAREISLASSQSQKCKQAPLKLFIYSGKTRCEWGNMLLGWADVSVVGEAGNFL